MLFVEMPILTKSKMRSEDVYTHMYIFIEKRR